MGRIFWIHLISPFTWPVTFSLCGILLDIPCSFFPRQLPLRKSIKVSEPMTVFGYTPQSFKVIYCIWFTLNRPYKDVARTNYWSHDVNLFHLKRITRRALNFLMHSPECICMLWFQLFHSSWRGRSKQRHVPSILFVNSHNLTSRWTQERG